MRRLLLLSAIALSPFRALAGGPEASFDCGKAATPAEILICADEKLAKSDRELAGRYARLRREMSPASFATVEQTQRRWLQETGTQCAIGRRVGDRRQTPWDAKACIAEHYVDRLGMLDFRVWNRGALRLEGRIAVHRTRRPETIERDTYPWMSSTPADKAEAFNHFIAGRLQRDKTQLAASGIKLGPSDSIDFRRSFDTALFDGRIVSIEVSTYHVSNIGHGWQSQRGLNWDIDRSRAITVAELFRVDSDWQQAIEEYALKVIHESGANSSDLDALAKYGAVADDEAWLFSPYEARLLLGHGERSGVGAAVEVAVPYAVLAPYLRPDAPLPPRRP